jgi:hypothetical protein
VRFYGLLDHRGPEVIEFYVSREAGELELEEPLRDEPTWVGVLELVHVDFAGPEVVVLPLR